MEKKIEDYLHLYLECECAYSSHHFMYGERFVLTVGVLGWALGALKEFKPILRPLCSMNNDDIDAWAGAADIFPDGFKVSHDGYNVEIDSIDYDGFVVEIDLKDGSMNCICKDNSERYAYNGADLFRHLLSTHFDLFGLIEAGLAIDKSKQ